ncbi:MAG: RMD1 family protein [Myxococcales bacterium]|nr:RMD1 family protein [Myxococcota bacterium]MDW8281999.1 RMD1 family protein [Myxococcales bacterium]
MSILPVHAAGFSATFRLRELSSALQGADLTIDKDLMLARFPRRDGLEPVVLVFDFGALVCAGLDPEERERLISAVSSRLPPEPHAPLTEDFLVEVRPGAQVEVLFDRVVVPEANLPVLRIVGLLLAQSVALDYYEEDVRDILERTDAIVTSLQATGRLPGRSQDLVRFIGSCMATRNAVIAKLALFDKPDLAWEHPQIDRLFNGLRLELEIADRYRALEAKLRMIQENLVLLADLSQQRSTWRVEMAIVLLILFEVGIMLWQTWRGAAH